MIDPAPPLSSWDDVDQRAFYLPLLGTFPCHLKGFDRGLAERDCPDRVCRIRDSLNGACERAGVPHIRVHGLRHPFGSQMGMAGADPIAIMKAMGHTDIRTTMINVSLGKNHIRKHVEKLIGIQIQIPSGGSSGKRVA